MPRQNFSPVRLNPGCTRGGGRVVRELVDDDDFIDEILIVIKMLGYDVRVCESSTSLKYDVTIFSTDFLY